MENQPLSGYRVIEFGQFIAVPTAGQMLSDAGAEVIKVEPLEGDNTRRVEQICPGEGRQYLSKNRGKRSVALNLSHPEGLAIAQKLVAGADVVLANFRPGLAASLGLDYESISKVNPKVVYGTNSAYGDKGPDADLAGFDAIIQAYSGLYVDADTTEDTPPATGMPHVDHVSAAMLAWGVTTALLHRERTGEGQEVRGSLLGGSMFLQSRRITHVDIVDGWRYDFLERLPQLKAEGRSWGEIHRLAGEHQPVRLAKAYQNVYRTADGAMVVNCISRPLMKGLLSFMQVEDGWVTDPDWPVPDDLEGHINRVHAEMKEKFKQRTTAEWLTAMREARLVACEVHHWTEMLEHPQVIENDLLYEFEHEVLGHAVVVGSPVKLSKSPVEPAFPPRPLGADTVAVLTALGYSTDQVAALAEAKAIGAYS